jgi:hypothetical protein
MELLFEVNSRAELILFWTVRAHVESCEHPDQERTNTCVAAALSLSQNILEQSRTAIRTEAAQHGLYSLNSSSLEVTISDAAFLELIHYRKSIHPQGTTGGFPIHCDDKRIVLPNQGTLVFRILDSVASSDPKHFRLTDVSKTRTRSIAHIH